MGSGSSNQSNSCCDSMQDCCRDMCGCCPCKCCKTTVVRKHMTFTAEQKIEQGGIDKPCGHGWIHAGVRLDDNTYTCPIVEIHTWRRSEFQTEINQTSSKQRVALGGLQTKRDNADHVIGPTVNMAQQRVEHIENVITIPIESIISITSSSDLRKEQTQHKSLVIKQPPPKNLSCFQRCCRSCNDIFCCGCCCCCNDDTAQVGPGEIITRITDQHARRKVLITIEYIRYSNIHTPSHTRSLAPNDQAEYYKEKFGNEILSFYLMDNLEFEHYDFDLKQKQAWTLCRLVTQLKCMMGHYPNEQTLEQIISRQSNLAIGEPPKENFILMSAPRTTTASLETSIPLALLPRTSKS